MLKKQKTSPHKDPRSIVFLGVFCLLAISVEMVRPDDYTYGTDLSSQQSDCEDCDNDIPLNYETPQEQSLQEKALNERIWRLLNFSGRFRIPNFDLMSQRRHSYGNLKRSQSVLSRMVNASPSLKKYLATLAKANSIQGRQSMMGKRSIATLAKNGQLPTLQSPEETSETEEDEEKRNVESLVRLGGLHQYIKRNLQALVRDGYQANKHNDEYGDPQSGKRNVGSLARNGELYNKNNPDKFSSYYKRNIGSFLHSINMPLYEEQKRNIGAMARDWALPNHGSGWQRDGENKRNVAALLRQDSYLHSINRNPAVDAYPTPEADEVSQPESKRNVPSIKAGASKFGKRDFKRSISSENNYKISSIAASKTNRIKRQADEYFSEISNDFPLPEIPKSDGFDYDELVKALAGDYLNNNKRFLGNIPLSRMTELGKISLMSQPAVTNATSPTYRRRQYLLSRTQPEENE